MKPTTPAKQWAVIIGILVAFVIFDSFGGCDKLSAWWVARSLPPPKPVAPLTINFRTSAISGLVLQVQNSGDKNLSCLMAVKNETQNQSTSYSFSLDPYKMAEIGLMECNWKFEHGEKVGIATEGYQNVYVIVP